MSLRLQAEQDLMAIMSDVDSGFGWPVILTSPEGASLPLTGFSADISQAIDPDTGQAVSGRLATVSLPMRNLTTLPRGIADTDRKPWIVEFPDIFGTPYKFKVLESNPDRTIGTISLVLGIYRD